MIQSPTAMIAAGFPLADFDRLVMNEQEACIRDAMLDRVRHKAFRYFLERVLEPAVASAVAASHRVDPHAPQVLDRATRLAGQALDMAVIRAADDERDAAPEGRRQRVLSAWTGMVISLADGAQDPLPALGEADDLAFVDRDGSLAEITGAHPYAPPPPGRHRVLVAADDIVFVDAQPDPDAPGPSFGF